MTSRLVVLVAGPPGGGKTTRARQLAEAEGLVLFDRDDDRWTGEAEFHAALTDLGASADARAVVIRSCATASAWGKVARQIGADRTELIATPADVCRRRIVGDTRPYTGRTWRGQDARLAGVAQWWTAHKASPWQPPRRALAPSRQW